MISHSLLGARVYAAAPLPPQRRPRPPLLSRTTSHPASLLQAAAIVGILREDRGTPLFCRSPSLGAWTRVRWPPEAGQLLRSSGLTPSPSHRRPAPFPPHGPPRAALTRPGDLGPVGPAPACDRAPASCRRALLCARGRGRRLPGPRGGPAARAQVAPRSRARHLCAPGPVPPAVRRAESPWHAEFWSPRLSGRPLGPGTLVPQPDAPRPARTLRARADATWTAPWSDCVRRKGDLTPCADHLGLRDSAAQRPC